MDRKPSKEELTKLAFASLYHPHDSHAARKMCGITDLYDMDYVDNPFFLSEKKRLLEEFGDDYFLPNRYDVLSYLWHVGTNYNDPQTRPADRIAAMKLYSVLREIVPKEAMAANNVTLFNVMKVPADMDATVWEKEALKQQAALIKNGKVRHTTN